jgi:hypothetical protein
MYSAVLTPSDLSFRDNFEADTLPGDGFRHRDHLRLTWIYLTLDGPEVVEEKLCRAIAAFAIRRGAAQKFHHTLTIAWVRLVEDARRLRPGATFEALLDGCAFLLDKDLPLSYYTRERLFSDEARLAWVEPDLRPLPGV